MSSARSLLDQRAPRGTRSRPALMPRKRNHEIHGNTLAHLHMHLFPRFDGDPFVGGPIEVSATGFQRTHEELAAIATAINRLSSDA